MRAVVLGATGQLGAEFVYKLGRAAVPLARADADATDPGAVERALVNSSAELVINCAAFNQVDAAETEHAPALMVNFRLALHLSRLSRARGWRLVHFSTDYVFGGESRFQPYVEDDRPYPINFYGLTKLMGEQAVLSTDPMALVLRVAHLFGGTHQTAGRASLVTRFLEMADRGQVLRASESQTLNPTSVADIVDSTLRLLEGKASGLYHVTGAGWCTAAEFAREVVRLAGAKVNVEDMADQRPARRPAFSVLENARLRHESYPDLPHWREALSDYLRKIGRLMPIVSR